MSVEALAVVLHHSKAIGTAKLVLLGIANHQGDGGSWPSIATLARYANVIPRNVQKALGQLVAMGEVEVHQRPGRSTSYRVLVACPKGCSGGPNHVLNESYTPVASDTPVECDTPVASDANPRRRRHPTPVASDTRTINEPSGTKKKTPTESSRASDRGTRLPDHFPVTDDMKDWAKNNAPTVGAADHEAFVDYWRSVPGAKGRKVDWEATWRGWMRRENERRGGRPTGRQPNRSTTSERVSQVDTAAAQLAATENAALATVTHLAIEGQPA